MSYTQEECEAALLEAARRVGDSPTAREYQQFDELPSRKTVAKRWGGWEEAKEAVGLESRQTSEWRKKPLNRSYFDEVDTTEKAYWLGFLYGDGYVSLTDDHASCVLHLKESDKSHIQKFIDAIDSGHKLQQPKDGYRVKIGNKEFVESLVELGCDRDKTTSEALPPLIGEELRVAFTRGLFDADGTVVPEHIQIASSSEKQLEKVADWLPMDPPIYESEIYRLTFYGEKKRTFRDWLYPEGQDTEPSLTRKRDKMV